MTFALVFGTPTGPVMFGDLLITSETPHAGHLTSAPTIHESVCPHVGERFLSQLSQKIILINQSVTVAWSGSYIHARLFINYLHHKLGPEEVTLEEFELVLNAFLLDNPSDIDKFDYVAIWISPLSYKIFPHGASEIDNLGFSNVLFIGSGSGDLWLQIRELIELTSKLGVRVEGVESSSTDFTNELGSALRLSTAMATYCTLAQYLTNLGLSNSWGGGFEIAYGASGSMKKLDNFIVQGFVLNIESNYMSQIPLKTYQTYVGKDLILFSQGDDNKIRKYEIRTPFDWGRSRQEFACKADVALTFVQESSSKDILLSHHSIAKSQELEPTAKIQRFLAVTN